MLHPSISFARIIQQQLVSPKFSAIKDIVRHMGAMQAQDAYAAQFAIASRLNKRVKEIDIEKAYAAREIVRTWLFRGTLHVCAPEDVYWMLALAKERLWKTMQTQWRNAGLDEKTMAGALASIKKLLKGGQQVPRKQILEMLTAKGIDVSNHRGTYILNRAAYEGLICFGPKSGKDFTFVLLEEWIPKPKPIPRKRAVEMLFNRYIESRGPATLKDFAAWSGLTLTEIRTAVKNIEEHTINDQAYIFPKNYVLPAKGKHPVLLLPAFDEFLLGYGDRTVSIKADYEKEVYKSLNGIFSYIVVMKSAVVGIWKRTLTNKNVTIHIDLFEPINATQTKELQNAAKQYGEFLSLPSTIHIQQKKAVSTLRDGTK
ncbi:winged helix DNA-binding protein [Chitinophaga skermanii]|uniref:Winged helix DNA-binding protein n=1 Tax=Chitinophaga skermanii TaxID=331697 RepID=A0A327Q4I8_9BACT|nr:winged helix DNA-binding domain-containing protein [Chitinophaga skermanii]RAI98651.1 winged helix DNA-binding protein [Chitinophaga skermanii]